MKNIRNLTSLAVGILLTLVANSASASLIDDDIRGLLGGVNSVPGVAVVNLFNNLNAVVSDPGVEFTGGFVNANVSADFDANSVLISFDYQEINPHGFFGFGTAFDNLDWVGVSGRIVGLIPDPNNTLAISNFSFGDHSVDIEFEEGTV